MTGFTYKSYSFIEKDPIIDEIRTVYERSGASYQWIHDHSGVTPATLISWFSGPTRRPQAATINAVLRALGYKLGVVETKAVVVAPPAPPAPPSPPAPRKPMQSARHIVQMSKYKRVRQ